MGTEKWVLNPVLTKRCLNEPEGCLNEPEGSKGVNYHSWQGYNPLEGTEHIIP